MKRIKKADVIDKLDNLGLEFDVDAPYETLYTLLKENQPDDESDEEPESVNPNNVVDGPVGSKVIVSSKRQPGRPDPSKIDNTVKSVTYETEKIRNHKGMTIIKTFKVTRTSRNVSRRLDSIEKVD
jgi:hypothetical protein